MPTYSFTSEDGDVIDEVFPMNARPESIERDGVVYTYDFAATHSAVRCATAGNWPMTSIACEVNPSDARLMMEKCEKYGVPTQYNSMGQPVLESPGHRRRFLKLMGYHDRNAGYSDPTPD